MDVFRLLRKTYTEVYDITAVGCPYTNQELFSKIVAQYRKTGVVQEELTYQERCGILRSFIREMFSYFSSDNCCKNDGVM